MNLKLKRSPGIYLVGFMGSGKSTVGRALAHRLGWSFFDLDSEIERAEGCAISEIFATRGEAEFRRIEAQMARHHVSWIERGSMIAHSVPRSVVTCRRWRRVSAPESAMYSTFPA